MPNMYARGILWGKMVLELGDSCTARNDRNGYYADLQFKTKVSTSFPPLLKSRNTVNCESLEFPLVVDPLTQNHISQNHC